MAFKNLEPLDFETELNANKEIILIDCRTENEFNDGHLPNSLNYNFNSGEFSAMIKQLDKSKSYFIYCRSGARSFAAANELSNQGFENVTNLIGGIINWRGEVV